MARGQFIARGGSFLVTMAGNLFRRAGSATRAAGRQSRRLADNTLQRGRGFDAARRARDTMHDDIVRQVTRGNASRRQAQQALGRRQVVTGAYDPRTRLSAGGVNGGTPGPGWPCAERNALDNLNALRRQHLRSRGKPDSEIRDLGPDEVQFSEARRIKPNGNFSEKPICDTWCQERTSPWQYPQGTRAAAGGRWDTSWYRWFR